ncbi:MAG: HEAT repeat domain-containing protein [Gemmatimonadota bacterium]
MHRSLYPLSLLLATALHAQTPVRPTRPAPTPAPAPRAATVISTEPFTLRYELDHALALSSDAYTSIEGLRSYSLSNSISSALAYADARYSFNDLAPISYSYSFDSFRESPRASWAPDDPADSVYRAAREQLNRGDYRRAAASFAEITRKFPSSVYAVDAPYYQAFALYRIGGTPELQEALSVLANFQPQENQRKAPVNYSGNGPNPVTTVNWRSSTSRGDADALAARIAGVLQSRGMGDNAAVKKALSARGDACDREEQSVRAEALSALMQSDAAAARQMATKILARRDECSVQIRRSALFLVGNQNDEAATATIVGVARNDPSMDIRTEAVTWLGRLPGDAALTALEEMVRSDTGRIQRVAASVLASSSNPRARNAMRGLIEKNDAPESLRMAAIDGLRGDRMTTEDAAWLRSIYPKMTSARVKERIVYSLSRVGGDANVTWLTNISRNEDEPIDARRRIIAVLGETMDIAALARLYDASAQGGVRETLIQALANRKEPAAVDKLIDIARNGTDPGMRRMAISVLARSKDPRANKLLLELLDK